MPNGSKKSLRNKNKSYRNQSYKAILFFPKKNSNPVSEPNKLSFCTIHVDILKKIVILLEREHSCVRLVTTKCSLFLKLNICITQNPLSPLPPTWLRAWRESLGPRNSLKAILDKLKFVEGLLQKTSNRAQLPRPDLSPTGSGPRHDQRFLFQAITSIYKQLGFSFLMDFESQMVPTKDP